MADATPKDSPRKTDSLKGFSATVDENGQNMGQDSPVEIASAKNLQDRLARDPGGEAETARLASGHKNEDATEATEAEMSKEAVAKLRGG